ncbi:MAG: hypothetical protein KZQ83_10730 [gamma proteobacterium symbiont of Taylorina sp.]|nr:hypothetical protein [gamma proteobacterium symbiont of Taylorina sp.]
MSSEQLENTFTVAQQYEQESILYRQYLYSTPADWDSLKSTLSTVFDSVSIDIEGVITLVLGNQTYKALMDSAVISGFKNTKNSLYFNTVGDKNNDGTKDFEVVFPDGDKQIIYLLP